MMSQRRTDPNAFRTIVREVSSLSILVFLLSPLATRRRFFQFIVVDSHCVFSLTSLPIVLECFRALFFFVAGSLLPLKTEHSQFDGDHF